MSTTIDIGSLSYTQLLELQKQLQAEIPKRQAAEKKEAIETLRKMAAERGFDLNELLGGKIDKAGKKEKVAVKYRSHDGTQEWSGRGRKPAWINDYVNAGGKLDALLVA